MSSPRPGPRPGSGHAAAWPKPYGAAPWFGFTEPLLKPLGENAAIFPYAFLRGKPINSRLSGIEGSYPVYAYRFTPDTIRPYPGIIPRGPHLGLITLSVVCQ